MPGEINFLSTQRAAGWASHPRLADYRVLVNIAHRSLVIRSVLADQRVVGKDSGGGSTGHGFVADLSPLGITEAELGELHFVIGETDECLPLPATVVPMVKATLTVEDILALAQGPRRWVTGETYMDASAAGLRTETIVDMLYRDYLGRPSDPNGLAHYTAAINAGGITFDDMRRGFSASDEFRLRRKYVDGAPGSIFSQKIVLGAASADLDTSLPALDAAPTVDARELAALDGEAFVTEVYRRLLQKEPDAGGMAHYLHQLGTGTEKLAIIRHIACELEVITLGVRVIEMDDPLLVDGEKGKPVIYAES